MKKPILIVLVLLGFALAPHVLAETTQGFTALAPITGLTDQAPTTGGLATFFNNLYKYLIGVAAIFAVIEIIWGGLEISTQDSVSKQSAGRERIQEAILGLVLVLSPVLVFSIINPSILNLSLNLPAIKASVPSQYSGNQGGGTPTTDTATGCTNSGGTYIQIVSCPSQASADAYNACTNGLTYTKVSCPTTDTNGNCPTPIKEYCTGKSQPVVYYILLDSILNPLNLAGNISQIISSLAVIPNQKAMSDGFIGSCQGDGGKVKLHADWNQFVSNFFGNAHLCSSVPNNGISVPSGKTAYCFDNVLDCVPPSS